MVTLCSAGSWDHLKVGISRNISIAEKSREIHHFFTMSKRKGWFNVCMVCCMWAVAHLSACCEGSSRCFKQASSSTYKAIFIGV